MKHCYTTTNECSCEREGERTQIAATVKYSITLKTERNHALHIVIVLYVELRQCMFEYTEFKTPVACTNVHTTCIENVDGYVFFLCFCFCVPGVPYNESVCIYFTHVRKTNRRSSQLKRRGRESEGESDELMEIEN